MIPPRAARLFLSSAWLLLLAPAWPAQAGERSESAALATTAPVASTDNAGSPAAAADATVGFRLGDLPLADRSDVATSAAQSLPGISLTATGLRLRGGGTAGVATFLDGFRLYHLRPPAPFVARADVLASGYGATLGDLADGAVMMTSLPAGPDVHARVDLFHEARELSPGRDPDPDGPTFSSNVVQRARNDVFAGAVSAPLLSRRISIAAAVQRQSGTTDGPADAIFPQTAAITSRDTSTSWALTARPTPRQQVDLLAALHAGGAENGDPPNVAPEAQPSRTVLGFMGGLRWTGRFGDIVTVRLQGSAERQRTTLEPRFCRDQPDRCDSVSPTIQNAYQNAGQYVFGNGLRRLRGRASEGEFGGSMEAHLGAGKPIEQTVRLAARIQSSSGDDDVATPSGHSFEYLGNEPETRTTYLSNDPSLGPGWTRSSRRELRHLVALEDDLRMGRQVWIRPGAGVVAGDVVTTDETTIIAGAAPIFSLSAGWDVTGDGRTWLRGSASRRVDPGADGITSLAITYPTSQKCWWDPATASFSRDCGLQGGSPRARTVGLPCGPAGVDDRGAPCARELQLPRTNESTVGVRRRLRDGLWIDLDAIYRRTTGLPSAIETNRDRIVTSDPLNRPGASGFRTGRREEVYDLVTSDDQWRRYVGATVSLAVRLGGLNALLAYTYSQQDTQSVDPFLGPRATTHPAADPNEQRHGVRVLGTYAIADVVSLGLVYVYDTGRPTPQLLFSGPGGTNGTNPGVDINNPDDARSRHFSDTQRLDLQARLRVGRWTPFGFDLYIDVLNALDERTLSARDGRWTRVGAEFRY